MNYNNSLTLMNLNSLTHAILGMIPLTNHDCDVRSQPTVLQFIPLCPCQGA